MGLLDGKVAVVTGAGRGIGRGIALLAANEGAKVVVNDFGGHFDGSGEAKSPADEVVSVIKDNGGEAVANYNSVSDFDGAKNIIQTAIDNFGKLNIPPCDVADPTNPVYPGILYTGPYNFWKCP